MLFKNLIIVSRMILFFAFASSLQAQNEILLTRQAEVYVEAKEYDQAKDLFEKLSKEKLQPWQKARLFYNLGTLYLNQGFYEEALKMYSQVSFSPHAAPFTSRALATNLTVLKLEQAKKILALSTPSLEEESRALFLVREASQHLEEAEESACAVEMRYWGSASQAKKSEEEKLFKSVSTDQKLMQGPIVCHLQEDLEALHTDIKIQLALIAQKLGYLRITSTPIREGIPFLLSGVNLAKSHLDFLEHLSSNLPLREKYVQLFASDVESWLSLWEYQVNQMPKLIGPEALYKRGIDALKESKFHESRLAFLRTEEALVQLMKAIWGDNPLREVVQKVLVIYQQAFDQNPIQPAMLYQLSSEQGRLKELMESEKSLPIQVFKEIAFSDEALKKSVSLAKLAKKSEARFYFFEARQRMRRVLRALVTGNESLPENLLNQGIEEQVHALTLTHLFRQIKGSSQGSSLGSFQGSSEEKGYLEKVFQAQEEVLASVAPFFEAVIEEEQKKWPLGCQCLPWKQVIPLFIKGLSAAEAARDLLEKDPTHPWIGQMQEETVKYWKEALEKMHHPDEENKKEEEESAPPPPSQEPQETPSMQELLRQLQNMAQDDVKPKPDEKPPQQGARPW